MRPFSTLLVSLSAAALMIPFSTSAAQVKVTTAGGNVVLYTEKNVVDHMIVGDSLELEIAKLASTRSKNQAVRDFATMLVTDHTKHLENLRKIAESDVGRTVNTSDSTGIHLTKLLTQLQGMAADSGFDQAFIRHEVQHHQNEIAWLKQVRPGAAGDELDDDLGKDIDATLPTLEQHLAKAKTIAGQLGIVLDSAMKKDTTTKKDTTFKAPLRRR
jgi:putative membrane protein